MKKLPIESWSQVNELNEWDICEEYPAAEILRVTNATVFYHGTNQEITGDLEPGAGKDFVFITTDYNTATQYGKIIYEINLPADYPVGIDCDRYNYDDEIDNEQFTVDKVPREYIHKL